MLAGAIVAVLAGCDWESPTDQMTEVKLRLPTRQSRNQKSSRTFVFRRSPTTARLSANGQKYLRHFVQDRRGKGLIPVADTAFAPYFLGIDKGIFEKHDLKVVLEPGTPDLNPVKMVSQNSDQFGVLGGPELLLSGRAKGAPIIGIALIHKDSGFVIVLTLKESGILRVEQLQGKKVGFFFG